LIFAIIERMMVEHLPTVMPSPACKTLRYMSGQRPKLAQLLSFTKNWI
jgi:transposase